MKTIRQRLSRYGAQVQHYRGKMVQAVHESLSSVKMTKVLGREEHFLDTFAFTQRLVGAGEPLSADRGTEAPRLILEVTAIAGLLAVAAVLTAVGKQAITITVTLALLSIALR